ncbi:NAD-dependent epimerase/dehydratase family protein [Geotalea sp. SG265]|uniref:NAD-dependent epimerase/dehydratase family protein n=1 Tax=Geotalea sp. SG265 TaxID=2922867 RepID=UPI001FAF111D|nr:NAD-dependent epimerase/dehydratase family protein [Geotalea sp. SG265]
MMKFLILGGNGFIGSHLVDRLLAAGHKVRVFDKYEEHYRKPIAGVDYRFGDFGNRGLLADALVGVNTVFHLISTTLPKTSNDDPAFDIQSNVVETIFLLEQCIVRNIKVIFVSSGGTVYGKPLTLPIAENSPTDPECSYGITKLMIEKYLALFKLLHNLDYTIVRPSNPYGSRQNPNGIQGAISVFLGKVARNEPIEIWGDGEVVRDYVYIEDLAEGIYRAATKPTESRIFNLGSGTGYSLNEIVETIRTVTGREVQVEYKPKRTFDVPRIYLDIARARTELDWAPVVSLPAGIAKTWEFVMGLQVI